MRFRVENVASLFLLGALAAATLHAQVSDVASHERQTIEIEGETPEPPKSADVEATVAGIVERSNAFREQEGREPVAVDQTLQGTAQEFANYMAENDRYGHQADGRTPSQRAKAHGYDFAIVLENIAYAYDSRGFEAPALAEKLVQGWIDSPPHRENLLDPDVTVIGVGVAESRTTHYYYAVQMFGRPASLAVEFSLFNVTQTPIAYEIDGRSFTLEPRYVRTHTSGRPPQVTIRWPEESKQQPTVLKPDAGDRYRIEAGEDGAFRVEKTAAPAESPQPASAPSK
jgi:uncharacterized protein YkwD